MEYRSDFFSSFVVPHTFDSLPSTGKSEIRISNDGLFKGRREIKCVPVCIYIYIFRPMFAGKHDPLCKPRILELFCGAVARTRCKCTRCGILYFNEEKNTRNETRVRDRNGNRACEKCIKKERERERNVRIFHRCD